MVMKNGYSILHRFTAAVLLCAVVLTLFAGCGKQEDPAAATEPTAQTEATTELPKPVTLGDGRKDSLLCQATYFSEGDPNAVVTQVGEEKLTNRMLRIAYAMEVAAYRAEGYEPEPDYDAPLDAQLCPMGGGDMSWQHYFLEKALTAWHTQKALWIQSCQVQPIVEKNYKAEEKTHEQFFPDTLPAFKLAYVEKSHFEPNQMHEAYLEQLPEMLEQLAADEGTTVDALAKELAGSSAGKAELEEYAHLLNWAYIYFTELSYKEALTADEIKDFYEANQSSYPDGEKVVSILHCLLRPEGAKVQADGTVTAEESAWEACKEKAETLIKDWRNNWLTNRNAMGTFAELAHKNSEDEGTAGDGGRLYNVRKGQLHPQMEEWCFDSAREPEDVGIFRTDMGYEIVFLYKTGTAGEAQAGEDLLMMRYRNMLDGLLETYPMTVDFSKVSLVDAVSPVAPQSILYADVAHEHYPVIPVYLQQDYAPAPFGVYRVHSHGCGITTMAMISSYLADRTLTPAKMALDYEYYAVPHGTNGDIFRQVPAELGYFFERTTNDWDDVEEALRSGKVVVSLQHKGYFTSSGHYLALQGMTENGKVIVRDSNVYNYGKLPGHKIDEFDIYRVHAHCAVYWIFEPKITRIAACSRCGDPKNVDMPEGLLREDYICEKCQVAVERRDGFIALGGL